MHNVSGVRESHVYIMKSVAKGGREKGRERVREYERKIGSNSSGGCIFVSGHSFCV